MLFQAHRCQRDLGVRDDIRRVAEIVGNRPATGQAHTVGQLYDRIIVGFFPLRSTPSGQGEMRRQDLELMLGAMIDRGRQGVWLHARHVHRQAPCNACWARYLCGGGCNHEVIRRGRPACDYIRGWLHYCLEAFLRLSAQREGPRAPDRAVA